MANGNGKFKMWIGIGFSVIVLGGGWLVTWGQTIAKIDSLEKTVAENRVARDTTIKLDTDIAHIKQEQQEIKDAIKEQDKKLDKILDKLTN